MRVPKSAHANRPWRIHRIAPEFRVEDVWALPTPGGPDDLPRLMAWFAKDDGPNPFSGAARVLFAVRQYLGKLFGWDTADSGVGSRVPTLRTRLPEDLREGPRGPDLGSMPFTSVYLTDTEWTAESANKTVHTVMHIGWVPDGAGGYRGQMAVLVKPNGLLGRIYMAAVMPFRHLIVYPALMRMIGRGWRAGTPCVPTVRQQHTVPPAIRALGPVDTDYDYIDVFTLSTDDASPRSPEQWARAALEDVAGLQGQFIWRVVLGLRLKRRATPGHVAGWRIADRSDRGIRLEARSWMMTGHLVVHVDDGQVSLATMVRYDRRTAARVWSPLSAVHRRLAPGLLLDASRTG